MFLPTHFARRTMLRRQFSSQSSLDWLAKFTNFEQRGVPTDAGTNTDAGFDLRRMHRLLETLDSPHRAWPVVHIAGTKGKGSTSAMLTSILQAAGCRVGTYTSPHIVSLHERIAITSTPIAATELDSLVERYATSIESLQTDLNGALTHFEILTALAFRHFADSNIDVAVVEAGLGGARDATNVFDAQTLRAAVITAIGHDHATALGGSIEAIAAAKAGIMKQGRPVVLGRQPEPAAEAVLLKHAQELGCEVLRADTLVQVVMDRDTPANQGVTVFDAHTRTPRVQQSATLRLDSSIAQAFSGSGRGSSSGTTEELKVNLGLVGAHQIDNAASAITAAAASLLQNQDNEPLFAAETKQEVTLESITKGLESTFLPGRFQVRRLSSGPLIVLDGAHTKESSKALADTLRSAFPHETIPIALVLAMASDKDHREVCAELRSIGPCTAIFTEVSIAGAAQRSAPPGALVAAWQAAGMGPGALEAGAARRPVRCRELIQASLPTAVAKAVTELKARALGASGSGGGASGVEGVVVVTGSLHAVGAALKHLDFADKDV